MDKKLKVIEAFAGYGSQAMALKSLGFELTDDSSIIEWTVDAIIAYAAAHHPKELEVVKGQMKAKIEEHGKAWMAKGMAKSFTLSTEKTKGWTINGKAVKVGSTAYKEFDKQYKETQGKTLKEVLGDPSYLPMFEEDWMRMKEDELALLVAAIKVSNNFGSIMEVKGTDVRTHNADLFTYSFPCFTGDTLVNTQRGLVPIKNVEVGDKVTTHKNNIKEVIDWAETGTKEIWEVSTMISKKIRTTHNHKFWVRKKEKALDKQTITFENPKWVQVEDLNENYYVGHPINNLNVDIDDLSNDELWLLGKYTMDGHIYDSGIPVGKYTTDGHIYDSGIVIPVNDEEIGNVENHCEHMEYKIHKEGDINKIYIASKKLNDYALKIGTHLHNKEIPKKVLNLPKERLEIFLDGYWSRKVVILPNGLQATSTVSEKLAYSLGEAIAKVYNVPYKVYHTETSDISMTEESLVEQRYNYVIRFKRDIETQTQDESFIEGGFIWAPIRDVVNTKVEETVYDITVKDDESFTVYNTIVHNCQDLSLAGKQKGIAKGTRSGLLFEVERILEEQTLEQRPKLLLLENVKALVGGKHREAFDTWLEKLEELGYSSSWRVLNAKEHNLPQNRERVFVLSWRKDLGVEYNLDDIEKVTLENKLKNYLEEEENVEEKYYLSDTHIQSILKWTAFERPLTKVNTVNSEDIGTITTRSGDNTSSQKLVIPSVDINGVKMNLEDIFNGKPTIMGINPTSANYRSDNVIHGQNYFISTLRAGNGMQLVALDYDKYKNKWMDEENIWKEKAYSGSVLSGEDKIHIIIPESEILRLAKLQGTESLLVKKEDGLHFTLIDNTTRLIGEQEDGSWLLPISREYPRNILQKNQMELLLNNEQLKLIYDTVLPLRIRKITTREAMRLMGVEEKYIDNIFKYVDRQGAQFKLAGNSIAVNVLKEIFKLIEK